DPAGIPNVGNSAGTQLIGGQCLSSADCGSGCCAGPAGVAQTPAHRNRQERRGMASSPSASLQGLCDRRDSNVAAAGRVRTFDPYIYRCCSLEETPCSP
ncbi:hypothetical protein B0H17DRAFT_923233, partial [Mycena rosella]